MINRKFFLFANKNSLWYEIDSDTYLNNESALTRPPTNNSKSENIEVLKSLDYCIYYDSIFLNKKNSLKNEEKKMSTQVNENSLTTN